MKTTLLNKKIILRLILALIYILAVAAFVKISTEVQERVAIQADIAILKWVHQFATPWHNQLAVLVTHAGGVGAIVGITAASSLALYLLKRRRTALVLLIGVGGAAVINTALKLSFQRVRPDLWTPIVHEPSFSFPSGHAMMSSALAFTIILIFWQTRWRWYAVIIGAIYTVVIGFTRIYLGVHFPSDVVGGWIVSLIWLMSVHSILSRTRIWPLEHHVIKGIKEDVI